MGSLSNSSSLQNISTEFCFLLRFQKQNHVFGAIFLLKPKSNIFIFLDKLKIKIHFLHKSKDVKKFSFLILTKIFVKNLLIIHLDYLSKTYWAHQKKKINGNFSTSIPCTIVWVSYSLFLSNLFYMFIIVEL